jgi:hypothetical protein
MEDAKRRRLDPVRIDWRSLPEELFPSILSHLDVATLVKQTTSTTTRRAFSTRDELRQAVLKYCGYNTRTCYYSDDPQDAEEFAKTYGYPINKWDVSSLQDFSGVFKDMYNFNEDISSWNVLNATSMESMFQRARMFNQDLSSWNVSHGFILRDLFQVTTFFNGKFSSWDVSHVTNMSGMFSGAFSFHQDLSSWNVSNVFTMGGMFCSATSSNQDLSL